VLIVGAEGLTSQCTCAFSFDASIDAATPVSMNLSDGSFLMASSATLWTGTACQAPSMLAHIPASSTDAYYVCPPAQ